MKICPHCGAPMAEPLDSCPQCANSAGPPGKAPSDIRLAATFFGRGLIFEFLLFGFCLALQTGPGELAIPAYNFFFAVHVPVWWFTNLLFPANDFVSVTFLTTVAFMGVIWGGLIYLLAQGRRWLLRRFHMSEQNRFLSWPVLLAASLAIMAAVYFTAQAADAPVAFTPSPEIQTVVDGNNALAIDLYRTFRDRPGNLIFSPASIAPALAMTGMGARGKTAEEINAVLHFDPAQEKLSPAFQSLNARWRHIQRWNRITLTVANALWYQSEHLFIPAYLDRLHADFGAQLNAVDFQHSPAAAREAINRWAGEQTHHKINGTAGPEEITADTRLVLTDAIYFKGKWLTQFKASATKPASFYVSTNETVTVPMMFQNAQFKLMEDDTGGDVQVLELPYAGQDLSMIILLPSTPMDPTADRQPSLSNLEAELTAAKLRYWLATLDRAEPHAVCVGLPRFTATQNFDLIPELKLLGMTSAFGDLADFSGMDGTTDLYLSAATHEAGIEVNESGTEAEAVTRFAGATKGIPERFIADHPFLFLIRDNASGCILFLGRISNPNLCKD